jgi:dethiobiotin synthetase
VPAPIFITGTDTGVGKTVLTALLFERWRRRGWAVRAIKPFATGSPADARLLDRLQAGRVPPERLCPFRFRAPLAPWVAARREGREVALPEAVAAIRSAQRAEETLVVEGCGGLLTPLGPRYSLRELLVALEGRAVVVAPNRLGVLNQVRLVLEVLASAGSPAVAVVLRGARHPALSAASNGRALRELAAPVPVFELPWLGSRANTPASIRRLAEDQRARLDRLTARVLPALPKKGAHSPIPAK